LDWTCPPALRQLHASGAPAASSPIMVKPEHLGTPEQTGRCSPESRRNAGLHTRNTGNTAKAMSAPKYEMRSPVFGVCNLVPQGVAEMPSDFAIGYVELEGAEGKLLVAIHKNGEWRTRNLRAFAAPVLRWYKVEKADGQPVF